jgi:tRNA pseudouridine38-40 synthase
MTRRYRATVAYDGARYNGFQRQPNAPTVQNAIEEAIRSVSNQHVNILCAGRTDTGVHAHHQVIAWDLTWRHRPEDLHRAINANLPRDIALQTLTVARAGFHPRYDALSRVYQYQIYNAAVRHPLYARTAWHITRPLDASAMQQAAGHLIGEHDFAAFGRPTHPDSTNTVRTVYKAQWATHGVYSAFIIEANAFLQRMVRRIVGALVQVGDGSHSPDVIADHLAAAGSTRAGPSAPPQGLSLINVKYVE